MSEYDCDIHLHELLGLKHPKHVRAHKTSWQFIHQHTKEAEDLNLAKTPAAAKSDFFS